MVVGAMLLRLHVPTSQSLKDKRQVVKSLTVRLANQFGVAAAEVGELGSWQIAELGVSYVSNQAAHVGQVFDAAMKYVEDTRPDLEILDAARDISTFFE
jgi:uncharacterized protein YlxP (DUF503 family)